MEVKERLYLTEGERATNDTLKADILMSFISFKKKEKNREKERYKKPRQGKSILNNN